MRILSIKQIVAAIALPAFAFCIFIAPAPAGVIMSSPLLPPIGNDVFGLPTGYLTATEVHTLFSGMGLSVILKQVIHQPFALIERIPQMDGSEIEKFQSTLTALASVNAGPFMPFTAIGPVITRVHYGGVGPVGSFLTEMLSLDLVGPAGVLIRESPTLQSTGQTTVQPVMGGFRIDSFFDVFTELSPDGGMTWIPNDGGPTHVELNSVAVPEPATSGLLIIGVLGLVWSRARRRS